MQRLSTARGGNLHAFAERGFIAKKILLIQPAAKLTHGAFVAVQHQRFFGQQRLNGFFEEHIMKIIENPDKELVAVVKEGLRRRGGYCPCRREDKEEYKCMCEEFKAQIKDPDFEGYCHCMLYYKSK